jgi:putative transposase
MVVRKRLNLDCGGLAYVTTTVKDWIPVFGDEEAATAALGQLAETTKFFGATIDGYVLTPSHLHWIIRLPMTSELSPLVKSFKSLSSRKMKALKIAKFRPLFHEAGSFRLWKPRFDDFIIRTPEQFLVKLNYIHENPVRAGLVETAIDYKYSSAADWLDERRGLIEINKEGLDMTWC